MRLEPDAGGIGVEGGVGRRGGGGGGLTLTLMRDALELGAALRRGFRERVERIILRKKNRESGKGKKKKAWATMEINLFVVPVPFL